MFEFSEEQNERIKNLVQKYTVLNSKMVAIKEVIKNKTKELELIKEEIKESVNEEKLWIQEQANKLKITPTDFNNLLKQKIKMT